MPRKKPQKPTVTPVITGIHPPKGEKRIIALHNHPEQIKYAISELKKEAENEPVVLNLFTDIEVLVHWALARLPLVPPPTDKSAPEGENPAPSADGEKGQ
jgi:hypothetical protein